MSKDKTTDKLNAAMEKRGLKLSNRSYGWKASWKKGCKKAIRIINRLKEEEE